MWCSSSPLEYLLLIQQQCDIVPTMNNYKAGAFKKRGEGFGGRSKVGGHRGSDKRSGGKPQSGSKPMSRPTDLFKAECATCHKDCMLPFRPSTDKPVYCSDCFAKKNAEHDRVGGRRDSAQSPRSDRAQRSERPQSAMQPNYELTAIKLQLKTIEDRLNRVLDIINPPLPPKKSAPVVTIETVSLETEVVKKKVTPKKTTVKKTAPVAKAIAKKAVVKKAATTKK